MVYTLASPPLEKLKCTVSSLLAMTGYQGMFMAKYIQNTGS